VIGYLSLGSNLGDRRAHLQAAVDALRARGVDVRRSSAVYDTEPVGLVPDQPEFLNACLEVATDLEPLALLDLCKAVEAEVGRTAGIRHGPRVIDIDVLLLGEATLRHQRLNLPHEDLANRRFVLVPLLELDPNLTLPGGERLAGSLAALGGGQAVRWAGPPLL
jgi:2-amino-4-hydroxy-6-hydroxymethyldihydropteridine diphosphokinase